jgi:hypothetical protein
MPIITATWEAEVRLWFEASLGKVIKSLSVKETKSKRTRGVVSVVEH